MISSCRLPVECSRRLSFADIECTPEVLSKLAAFCVAEIPPTVATFRFAPDVLVPLADGVDPIAAERALVSWAMAKEQEWSWHHVVAAPHPWRAEQSTLIAYAGKLKPNGIGLLEGSTGIGKTRVFSSIAAATASSTHRVVIAVPTRAIARIWQDTWALFSDEPLTEVWGKNQYAEGLNDGGAAQDVALDIASRAHAVLCTHQMIPKVLADGLIGANRQQTLFVDEAHLLSASVTGLAGQFVPAVAAGRWVLRWCEQQASPGTEEVEIELGGRMRDLVVKRMVPDTERELDWRVSLLTQPDAEPLLWLRHSKSVDAVWARIWMTTTRALLFSGTLSLLSASGMRTVHRMATRLAIPPDRFQDLGRVRPEWRDEGVTVLRPARHQGADGRPWLGAYRGREDVWWPEAAAALLALRKRPGKTLVLATSYADIDGIRAAMGRVAGVITSTRDGSVDEAKQRLGRKGAWCWLATGAAWTGMDTDYPLQRVVITKLPLPDPQAMRLLAQPQDAVFDAVMRLKQGIGRLVRAAGGVGLEIIVLDGRINDPSPRWRSICQPFMQVLGDEFESHGLLDLTTSSPSS